MAALTTSLLVGAAVVGAGATVANYQAQKKAASKQEDAMEEAETRAEQEAALDTTVRDQQADITLGRGSSTSSGGSTSATNASASNRTGSVANRVGGVKKRKTLMNAASTSAGIGL